MSIDYQIKWKKKINKNSNVILLNIVYTLHECFQKPVVHQYNPTKKKKKNPANKLII